MGQHIAHEVDAAALPGGVQHLGDGGFDAFMGAEKTGDEAPSFSEEQITGILKEQEAVAHPLAYCWRQRESREHENALINVTLS
jgi:hypothetical protein